MVLGDADRPQGGPCEGVVQPSDDGSAGWDRPRQVESGGLPALTIVVQLADFAAAHGSGSESLGEVRGIAGERGKP